MIFDVLTVGTITPRVDQMVEKKAGGEITLELVMLVTTFIDVGINKKIDFWQVGGTQQLRRNLRGTPVKKAEKP